MGLGGKGRQIGNVLVLLILQSLNADESQVKSCGVWVFIFTAPPRPVMW